MKMLIFKLIWKVKIKMMSNRRWNKTYSVIYLSNKENTPKGKTLLSILNRNASNRMSNDEYCFYRVSYLKNGILVDKKPELNEHNKHLYESLKNKGFIS